MVPEDLRDIYFLHEYAKVYEKEFQESAHLFKYGDDTNYVLMVGVKRSINVLSFCESQTTLLSEEYFDLSTPYGYGGPLIVCSDPEQESILFQGFRDHMHDYCIKNNIVSEFLRLHPKLANYKLFGANDRIVKKNNTVWIDLNQSESDIFKNMKNDPRRSIRIASENGVQVIKSELTQRDISEFHRLYTTTMERLGALPAYFFTLDYFEDLVDKIKGNISLFFSKWNDRNISAYMYVHGGDFIDLYLGGSDPLYWKLKGNPICLYTAALWAKSNGFKYYHMGGGHGAEYDSLFHFKSQFSPDRSPFYMYRHIHNTEMYNELCNWKTKFENQNTLTDSYPKDVDVVLKDYFPAYRR